MRFVKWVFITLIILLLAAPLSYAREFRVIEDLKKITLEYGNKSLYVGYEIHVWCWKEFPFSLEVQINKGNETFATSKYQGFCKVGGNKYNLFLLIEYTKIPPGDYIIYQSITNLNTGKKVYEKGDVITIPEIKRISVEKEILESALGKEVIFRIKNIGNIRFTHIYTWNLTNFEKWFFIDATGNWAKEGNKIIWTFEINPNEVVEVRYRVTYLPLLFSPFVLLVLIYLLVKYIFRIEVRRKILSIDKKDDKIIIKIVYELDNNKEIMKDVRVVEKLPKDAKLIEIVPKGEYDEDKNEIEYKIDRLSVGDVFTFKYVVELPVYVYARFVFGPSIVEYIDEEGNLRRIYSKTLKYEFVKKE